MKIPDEATVRDWKAIAIWLLACIVSAILGGMVTKVSCGCVTKPPLPEPAFVEVTASVRDAGPR